MSHVGFMNSAARRKQMSISERKRMYWRGIVPGFILLVFAFCLSSPSFQSSSTFQKSTMSKEDEGPVLGVKRYLNLQQGTVGDVTYYYCAAMTKGSDRHAKNSIRRESLVLLHGAKFTKEDWKSSDILSLFCAPTEEPDLELSVVALDLSVEATHQHLAKALDELERAKLVTTPVTLLTPSASGKCMVDWLQHRETSSYYLEKYIHRWIPVASGAIQQLSDINVKPIASKVAILAIYGDRDRNGKILSERLQQMAAPYARVLEIKGGHPCYLDSPSHFVKAVGDFMNARS